MQHRMVGVRLERDRRCAPASAAQGRGSKVQVLWLCSRAMFRVSESGAGFRVGGCRRFGLSACRR